MCNCMIIDLTEVKIHVTLFFLGKSSVEDMLTEWDNPVFVPVDKVCWISFNPFLTRHNFYLLLFSFSCCIANNMYQDQTQGSRLIWVHSVCFHDKINLKCTRICAADVKSKQHYQVKIISA